MPPILETTVERRILITEDTAPVVDSGSTPLFPGLIDRRPRCTGPPRVRCPSPAGGNDGPRPGQHGVITATVGDCAKHRRIQWRR